MHTFEEKTFSFTVDLPGLIDLMGTALYSEPGAAIRELIQNAHDGIVRRRKTDLGFQGKIRFLQCPGTGMLHIEDDGIGLNKEEAEKYLGTLGIGITGMLRRETETSGVNSSDLIGQFGIGLLSAFLLSDQIVVESLRFGEDAVPIRWEADGSTVIRLSPGSRTTPGTTVSLRLRSGQEAFVQSEDRIEESVRKYADFLNVPIFLNDRRQRINVLHQLDRTVNEAVRCVCRKDFAGAEKFLAGEERFLLGQQDLDHWFRIRIQRIASLLSAEEAGASLNVSVDALAEELRRRASKACQWSAIFALDAMLQRRVRLNPLGIAFPIDIGPYATEGTPVSVSPLNLSLPLIEKTNAVKPEQDAEKPEKSAFELEIESWTASLEPFWSILAAVQDASEEPAPPLTLADELNTLEREIFEKIVRLTPETPTGPNGEPLTETEFLAATTPLLRMHLLEDEERMKECWNWLRRMQKNFPERGRPLSVLAYHGFLFRGRTEERNLDPAALDLPSDEQLEQWISKAFELEPNRTGIATVAGMIFRAHGNNREAQRYFSRANQIDRLNEFAAVSLAELYEEAERPKDAMATIELYTRAGGRHPGLLWEGMQIAFRNEMPQEFLLYYNAYTETQPSHPALDAQRIWALCGINRFDEALAALDVFDGMIDEPGRDRIFLRALFLAELGNPNWLEILDEAMKSEDTSALIGTAYDPCQRLWEHVKKLPETGPRREEFVRFLFEHGLVPDNLFMPDDDADEDESEGEPPLRGYYRCIIRQPLDPAVPACAGWIPIPDTEYFAVWLVLADDEEEAERLVLEAQARCYPIPSEVLECEQLDSYLVEKSQIVAQGRRFRPSSEKED